MKKIACLILLYTTCVFAAPGAHGPNGEHLDSSSNSALASQDTTPKIEAFTENFELVGKLYQNELSVLIDDYQTNQPVLNAQLEINFNGAYLQGKFHSDKGDYSFDQPALLQVINKSGVHDLVFKLSTPDQTDLISGTLRVGETHHDNHDAHPHDEQAHEHEQEHEHEHEQEHGHEHGHGHGEGSHGHHYFGWMHSPVIWVLGIIFLSIIGYLLYSRRNTVGGNK